MQRINSIDKTVLFNPVQCTFEKLKQLEENNLIERGALYLVLDTKQIFLCDNNLNLIPMGKSTGVKFAKKPTNLNNSNPTVIFVEGDFEEGQDDSLPQENDLIFNSDGCFYRVRKISNGNIEAERLTVAGSGGGGSSNTSGGSNIVIERTTFDYSALPQYVVLNKNETYNITTRIHAFVNDKEQSGRIKVKIFVGEIIYEQYIPLGIDSTISIPNSCFKTAGLKELKFYCSYASKVWEETESFFSIEALDLDIKAKDIFKNSIVESGYIEYSGTINRTENSEHKIYFSLTDSNGNLIDYKNVLKQDYNEDEKGTYISLIEGNSFTLQFENLTYGIYNLSAYQEIKYNEAYETSQIYSYIFASSKNPAGDSPPIFFCDFSNVEGKTFFSDKPINIPIAIFDQKLVSNGENQATFIAGYMKSDGTILTSKTTTVILSDTKKQISFYNHPIVGNCDIFIKYQYENNEEIYFIVKKCNITIKKAESVNLMPDLVLTSSGRSNLDANKTEWISGTAFTDFENFTWTTDNNNTFYGGTGWCLDENRNSVLRVGGEAKAVINYEPFNKTDILTNGLSISLNFFVRNFSKRNDILNPIITCFRDGFGIKIFGDQIQFSLKQTISLKYSAEEKIHVLFNIKPLDTTQQKGIFEIYLNGILTYATLYTANDIPDFKSKTNFSIGSSNAIIDIYTIQIFKGAFTDIQKIVELYINSLINSEDSEKILRENNIFKNNQLDIELLKENTNLPIMILKGSLPTEKIDKSKQVSIEFYHPDNSYSFNEDFVNIEVQGTSSQYYPIKNYKLKNLMKKQGGYQLAENQVKTSTFCLKADYAESTSSHNTQNANLIETFYSGLKVKKNPAQMINENCRTTIFGYPIIVFHEYTSGNETIREFLGKYNFNFDKGSKEVFGFDGQNAESWEFKENTPITSMIPGAFDNVKEGEPTFRWDKWEVSYSSLKDSKIKKFYFPEDNEKDRGWVEERHTNIDYVRKRAKEFLEDQRNVDDWWSQATLLEDKIIPLWTKEFEPRYCKKVIKDEKGLEVTYRTEEISDTGEPIYETVYDITNFAKLYEWIMSTAGNSEKFSQEVENYFDMDYLLIYYVYTFFASMVDQRAKNMFFTYWEPVDENGNIIPEGDTITLVAAGGKWQPWFYDNDTCFGIDNTGRDAFDYDLEDDYSDNKQAFQGEYSTLWVNLKERKLADIKTVYQRLRAEDSNGVGLLTEDILKDYFINRSTKQWPVSIYAQDAQVKYINYAYTGVAMGSEKDAPKEEVLSKLRGNGEEHFKQYIKDRIFYCDSKFNNLSTTQTVEIRTGNSTDVTISLDDLTSFTTGFYEFRSGANSSNSGGFSNQRLLAGIPAKDQLENGLKINFGGTSNFGINYFYGIQNMSNLGNISAAIPLYAPIGAASKLEKLELGDKTVTDLLSERRLDLTLPLSPSLKTLDISNRILGNDVSGDIEILDLSKYSNLREILLRNGEIKRLALPSGGYLEKLVLSDAIEDITLKNQLLLEEKNLEIYNRNSENEKSPYRNIKNITIENSNKFNSRTFLEKCLSAGNPDDGTTEKHIRVINIDFEKDENGLPVAIGKDENGNDIYSDWVFKSEEEFVEFANLFANNKMNLKGKNDRDDPVDKPYLQGSCYILDTVEGANTDILLNNISGNLNILSKGASYIIRFYYQDPEDNEIKPIKGLNGEDYIQKIDRNNFIESPYKYFTDPNNPPVPNIFDYEGKNYIHNKQKNNWCLMRRGERPPDNPEISKNIFQIPIQREYDVFAVYTQELVSYELTFFNRIISDEYQIQDSLGYPIKGSAFYGELPQVNNLPNALTYPILDGEDESIQSDYEFNGNWKPSLSEPVYGNTRYVADYNYKAYQTYRLLEKRIIEFQADPDLEVIKKYSFYNCKDLKKIILNTNSCVTLEDINAFEGTVFSPDSLETLTKEMGIFVPEDLINTYKVNPEWNKISDKIKSLEQEVEV